MRWAEELIGISRILQHGAVKNTHRPHKIDPLKIPLGEHRQIHLHLPLAQHILYPRHIIRVLSGMEPVGLPLPPAVAEGIIAAHPLVAGPDQVLQMAVLAARPVIMSPVGIPVQHNLVHAAGQGTVGMPQEVVPALLVIAGIPVPIPSAHIFRCRLNGVDLLARHVHRARLETVKVNQIRAVQGFRLRHRHMHGCPCVFQGLAVGRLIPEPDAVAQAEFLYGLQMVLDI